MKDRLIELGYGAGWGVVRTLPKAMVWPVFRAAADRAARRRGKGAVQLERNLRRVVGPEVSEAEMADLLREALRSYSRYWLEAFRLPNYSREHVLTEFQMEDGHLIGEALAGGKGCLIALPHSGNWDYAGAWVCANGWPITTVAERLKPEGVYEKFVRYRESLGMTIVPATGGDRPPIDVLADALGANRVVPLLADRDLSTRGVQVDFFGAKTRMPPGPALLALRTGAPLLTLSGWYDEGRPRGRMDPAVPLPDPSAGTLDVRTKLLTQLMADRMAEGIARHPVDWHMLQRLWRDDDKPAVVADADQLGAGR